MGYPYILFTIIVWGMNTHAYMKNILYAAVQTDDNKQQAAFLWITTQSHPINQ